MSYATQCTDMGFSCERVAYFSNPRLFLDGLAFGQAKTIDAVQKMNTFAPDVINYRSAVSTPDSTTLNACEDIAVKALNSKNFQPCFLATASFGEDSLLLWPFRFFRDAVLMRFSWGRDFIREYYELSPKITHMMHQSLWFKAFIQSLLILSLPFIWGILWLTYS